jgi:hypothetical protein
MEYIDNFNRGIEFHGNYQSNQTLLLTQIEKLETTATTGSIETSKEEKKEFAKQSHAHNLTNQKFKELFPELCK